MPVLLGVLASVFIGVSDYYGRYCARRAHAMTSVGTAFIGGLGVTAVLLYFVPSTIGYEALVLGAVSGALMAVALSAMWHSMAISSAAVASPIVAAFTALGPLVYGLATGERPSRIVAAGIALAIVGLLAAVIVPDLGGRLRAGIAFAVLAGACFAVATVLLARTSLDSGMWPAVSQRLVASVLMLVATRAMRIPQILPRTLRLPGLIGGMVGGAGIATLIAGLQRGPVGEVAVAGSLFPIVTIALAVLFDEDRLRWWQVIGITAVLAGTTLMTVG